MPSDADISFHLPRELSQESQAVTLQLLWVPMNIHMGDRSPVGLRVQMSEQISIPLEASPGNSQSLRQRCWQKEEKERFCCLSATLLQCFLGLPELLS